MSTPKKLNPAERQLAAWLGEIEGGVILPLKWVFVVASAAYWMWLRDWQPPTTLAFGLFLSFVGITGALHYFFVRDRVLPSEVRPLVAISFAFDALFVCLLCFIDTYESLSGLSPTLSSDFFLLYILLILRGFALFQTQKENLAGFFLASLLFLLSAGYSYQNTSVLMQQTVLQNFAFIWVIMLITQAFVGLINKLRDRQLRSQEQMVKSASLAGIGELTAGVAHEINNPIGIIKTYAEYLVKASKDDSTYKEDYETIMSEAERCQQIVRRMLDFSNPQVEGLEAIHLRELVSEVASFAVPAHDEEKITVEILESPALPVVLGDPVQLKQAFLNIILNAKQVISERISESEDAEEFEGMITISYRRGQGPRPPIIISIEDNGKGLGQEEANRAFDPFFTRKKKGTGLGLAITQRIIDAHDGKITISPAANQGAIVEVTLPIKDEEEA